MTPASGWAAAAVVAATALAAFGRARGWTGDPAQAVLLATYVGAVLAIGVAGSLADPAGDVADAAPRPRWRRRAHLLRPAGASLAAAAAVLLPWCLPGAAVGTVAGVALDAAVLAAAAVAAGSVSRGRPGQPVVQGATAAAATPVVVVLLAGILPPQAAMIVDPEGGWAAAQTRWTALGGVLLILIGRAWADPGRKPRRPATGHPALPDHRRGTRPVPAAREPR